MYCGKCGTEITENGKFCPKCGAAVSAEQISEMPKASAEQTENLSNATVPRLNEKKDTEIKACKLEDKHIRQLSSSFISQDEKFIASLGNNYIINYLVNGSARRGFAFITDKRVYFKGTCLAGSGKSLTKTNEERTVDIESITGSGFIYHDPIGLKIAAILSFVLALIIIPFWLDRSFVSFRTPLTFTGIILGIGSILLFLSYLRIRKTAFRVEYAGGCIAFDVSLYAKVEMDDFQKQMRRAKDLAEKAAVTQASAPDGVPDDLRKYADLLKDGLISQEEYDAMKKKILNL